MSIDNYIYICMYVFLPSGQMLMNWLASSFQALPLTLNDQVLNIIAQQYCTNLLAVGVINQIPDKYAPIQDTFKVRINSYWLFVTDHYFISDSSEGSLDEILGISNSKNKKNNSLLPFRQNNTIHLMYF
jgi:hypothetical protein